MEPLSDLRGAVRVWRRYLDREQQAREAAREKLRAAAAAAMAAGVPQKQVAEETGLSRETLRLIAREYELPDGRTTPKSSA
jgi:DNA-binding XRE family transcriptional regulator